MSDTMTAPDWLGWHFATVADGGKPRERYGKRRAIVVGKRLAVRGAPALCECGMHASSRAYDALGYAVNQGCGLVATRVRLDGGIVEGNDKAVARGRTVLAALSAERTDTALRAFARRCALDVLPLWPDAPAVVREYLVTGDESIRAAVRDAAWAAARDAARAAARDAAWAAAWAAARDAARDAAWAAAWAAARAAARDAKIAVYAGWLDEMLTAEMEEDAA